MPRHCGAGGAARPVGCVAVSSVLPWDGVPLLDVRARLRSRQQSTVQVHTLWRPCTSMVKHQVKMFFVLFW